MAPETFQRTTLKEDRRSDPLSVMDRIFLDIQDQTVHDRTSTKNQNLFFHQFEILISIHSIFHNNELVNDLSAFEFVKLGKTFFFSFSLIFAMLDEP